MKKYLATALLCLSAFAISAQDYPDIYLRGDISGNWAINDNYRFERQGNVYTLTVDKLDGSFKIATEDWDTVDLGAQFEESNVVTNHNYTMVPKGHNFYAASLTNVTLSFTYTPEKFMTLIITGDPAPEPPVTGLSGTLPVLYINVYTDENHTAFDNEIISKDLAHKNYFTNAVYWLDTNGCQWLKDLGAKDLGSKNEPLPLQIKARGNWTRIGFSKKPFKLKLDKKASMLGMSKSKHYAIIAHADDNDGYLRNFTGFNIGKRMGLPWTPSMQPVEVVINGDYRGLYFLTESIRIEEDRINITELDDNVSDPSLASGGYLVELDNYDEDNQIRLEEKSCVDGHNLDALRITYDTPEEYSELQKRFVTDQFSAINDLIGQNSDDMWRYLDLDDAARYYIVKEIVSDVEAYHGSTYLFRDRGSNQKWHFSPLWDFGNAFSGPTDDFFYNHDPFGNTWIPSLSANGMFIYKVAVTWLWFMANEFDGLYDDIDTYVNHIAKAAEADHERWKFAEIPSGGQPVADNSDIVNKAAAVKNHLAQKLAWLSIQWGDYTQEAHPEPARDNTPAAPLPSYLTDGAANIEAADNAPAVYYNLQGIRIDKPENGLVIERRGTTSRKVLIK